MKKCQILIQDEVNVKISGLELEERRYFNRKWEYVIPGARFSPAVRLGRWNGKTSFFSLGGATYYNYLEEIIPHLYDKGYDIEIKDNRAAHVYNFENINENSFSHINWPTKHPLAGQPIVLRDYQVEAVNTFLQNPQGIQSLPTGSGKCLTGDTWISFRVDDSEFRSRLGITSLNDFSCSFSMLVNAIEQYRGITIVPDQEIDISGLYLSVPSPSGWTPVTHIIKKPDQPILNIEFDNGNSVSCAEGHIFQNDIGDVFAIQLAVGDKIKHKRGDIEVVTIQKSEPEPCYDLSVPFPHLYYDFSGILHHNTIITAALSKCVEPYGRSVVVVPSKSLVLQTEEDYLNLELDTGVYFGDRKDFTKTHTICTWQSLNAIFKSIADGELDAEDFGFDQVVCGMVDEAHTCRSEVLRKIFNGPFAHLPIRWGLTGTVPKSDLDKAALFTTIGPVIGKLATKSLQDQGVLAKCHVHGKQLKDPGQYQNYQSELKFLLTDDKRISHIAEEIKKIAKTGNTLVLVDRIQSGQLLAEKLDTTFISGSVKATERKDEYETINLSDNKILVATFGCCSTGININRIFNLVLIEPGKSFVRVIQSIGRGLRVAQDKDYVDIYDFFSTCKFSKRHFNERKTFYKESEYPFTVDKVNYL